MNEELKTFADVLEEFGFTLWLDGDIRTYQCYHRPDMHCDVFGEGLEAMAVGNFPLKSKGDGGWLFFTPQELFETLKELTNE